MRCTQFEVLVSKKQLQITIMKQRTIDEDLDAQFLKGLENISIDTESDFDDSAADLQQEKREQQARRLEKEKNNMILQELRNRTNMDNEFIHKFEEGFDQVVQITRGQAKQVLNEDVLKEIKKKVSAIVPEIVLAQEKIAIQPSPDPQHKHQQPKSKKQLQKAGGAVKPAQQQSKLSQKMEKMFQQREIIEMTRQDRLSMKYQEDYHSNLLAIRYTTPSIKMVYGNTKPIQVICPEPAFTYTNLQPQVNNEDNVLSKHSKVLAFRALASLGRPKPIAVKVEDSPVVFAKCQVEGKFRGGELKLEVKREARTADSELFQEMRKHFSGLSKTISSLEEISRNYRPKLLKQHLEGHEKALNVDIYDQPDQSKGKSLSRFIQSMQNPQKLKELRITFESLCDLKGISELKSIQYASLQYNLLTEVNQLAKNTRLIEINLSNNKLKSCKSLQGLKWLRYADLHKNQLTEIPELPGNMEVLNARQNRITKISGLNNAKNLRRLDLSNNRIEAIAGIDNLCFLDELDLSKNSIKQLRGVNQCVLLRRMLLADNQITKTNKLVLIFLNELDLRHNQLSDISCLILPSLQTFYLTHNLISLAPKELIYLPSLKLLNADHNRLCGFSPLFHLLRFSTKVEMLKYDDNEELSFAPEKVREFYEYLVYRRMGKLGILNQSEFSIGLKRYYQSRYDGLVGPMELPEQQSGMLESKISITLLENSLLNRLEKDKDPFSQQPEFIWLKSVKVAQNLIQIQKGLNAGWLCFDAHDSIFHRLDLFRLKFAASQHKLRSLVVNWKYKKEKRAKFLKKMLPKIKQYVLDGVQWARKFGIIWVVEKFKQLHKYGVGHEQAIKIQKVWRGYWLRKRLKTMMAKLKAKKVAEQQDYEFGEIDLDFFENPVDFDFKLKIPQNFNFDNLIIRPQVFRQVEQLPAPQRPGQLPVISINLMNQSNGSSQMSSSSRQHSNQMGSRNRVELPKINKAQTQEKIMHDWNFADPNTALMMMAKAEKKRKEREKEKEKNMTAAERYEKFKQQSKKK